MKKLFVSILAALLIMQPLSAAASSYVVANATATAMPVKSIDEIKEKWNALKPKYTGLEFLEQPSVSSPYSLGRISDGLIQDGLNMVNFVRYIAGLPDDCEIDAGLASQAQHGAVLMAANDKLTHTPSNPADMPLSFFNIGYSSATSSNLYYISGHKNYLLADSIVSYMRDEDDYNIPIVGHRRWILNPPLKKVGFGLAGSSSGAYYSALYIFDKSGAANFDYDYVSWPANGHHPVELFLENDPWSVSLDTTKFDNKRTKNISVKLTKKTTGKSWTLNEASSSISGNYFNVDTSARGVSFCIIFRPLTTYVDGDLFDVEISGVYRLNATTPTTIKFSTKFFKLDEPVVAVPEPEPEPPRVPATAIPSQTSIYLNGNKISLEAYMIEDYNYFKLRDIAYILSGTEKEFSLAYDTATNSILMERGKPYTTNGEEMTPPAQSTAIAQPIEAGVYMEGQKLSLVAYQIGDNNFFRLRDIAKVMNFSLSYDFETNSGIIDTGAEYAEE